jgi:hypothetical protein
MTAARTRIARLVAIVREIRNADRDAYAGLYASLGR